jgi:Flp pilus assembly protein TadD
LAADLAIGNPGARYLGDFGAAMGAGLLHPIALGYGAKPGDLLQQATFALNANRPQEAQRIAQLILKTEPRHAKALHVLGCALLMQDRIADAVAPLEEAARASRDPETDTALAIALRRIGRVEDALSRLKRAIKRRPPYAPAFHELGYLLMSLEHFDEAIEALRRGLEIAPMMPELSILLGNVFLECRNFPNAKVSFARALAAVRTSGRGGSVSALPDAQTRRREHVTRSRPLSSGTRAARRWLRVFLQSGARAIETLWHRAGRAGELGPLPVLAQTERRRAFFARDEKLTLRRAKLPTINASLA